MPKRRRATTRLFIRSAAVASADATARPGRTQARAPSRPGIIATMSTPLRAEPAATEADNHRRWDGRARGHYEVWYLTVNHRERRAGFWIRYTLESPEAGHGEPYAQLWFAFFDRRDPTRNFALNERRPIAAMRSSDAPFALQLGDARLTHQSAAGALEGHGHRARWELRWPPGLRTSHHLPGLMYRRGGLGETTVLSPNHDVAITGEIELDGHRLLLQGEPGGQTHLWGRRHAHLWAWGRCNTFEGRPRAVFESLTVHLQRAGLLLPPLTVLTLTLDSEPIFFNQFHHLPFTSGHLSTGSYRFAATGPRHRLRGEFRARPEDMVLATYADPDGAPSYCANTEVGAIELLVERRGLRGWSAPERLHSPFGGHFEVGARARDPEITSDHLTIL
jgi:hypothetical protein